jgi:hypothetical protein
VEQGVTYEFGQPQEREVVAFVSGLLLKLGESSAYVTADDGRPAAFWCPDGSTVFLREACSSPAGIGGAA